MSAHIDGMVVVATGVPAIVTLWSMVLRNAGLEFAVTHHAGEAAHELVGSMDFWVEERRVLHARSAIIDAERGKSRVDGTQPSGPVARYFGTSNSVLVL
jgi:hypothetical protein